MWQYRYTDELYHHGVKGMKWGVRRKNLKSAKQQYRKRTDKAFDEYERTIAKIERPYKRGQNLSKADMDREAAAEKKYSDAVAKAKSGYESTKEKYRTAKKALKADERAKAIAEKQLAKAEKQKCKDFVKKRSKEILKGESVAGKIWDVLTDGHKIQAKIEYDIDRRAKVNKAWRD